LAAVFVDGASEVAEGGEPLQFCAGVGLVAGVEFGAPDGKGE
jgi:hypothetical protein